MHLTSNLLVQRHQKGKLLSCSVAKLIYILFLKQACWSLLFIWRQFPPLWPDQQSANCVTIVKRTDWSVCFRDEITFSQKLSKSDDQLFSYMRPCLQVTTKRSAVVLCTSCLLVFFICDEYISAPPREKNFKARATLASNYTQLAVSFPTAYLINSLDQ